MDVKRLPRMILHCKLVPVQYREYHLEGGRFYEGGRLLCFQYFQQVSTFLQNIKTKDKLISLQRNKAKCKIEREQIINSINNSLTVFKKTWTLNCQSRN